LLVVTIARNMMMLGAEVLELDAAIQMVRERALHMFRYIGELPPSSFPSQARKASRYSDASFHVNM
jgi:hypothetical protein